MKVRAVAACFGALVLLGACGGGGGSSSNAWPHAQSSAFLTSCQQKGGTSDQCKCALTQAEKVVHNKQEADALAGQKAKDLTQSIKDNCS